MSANDNELVRDHAERQEAAIVGEWRDRMREEMSSFAPAVEIVGEPQADCGEVVDGDVI